MDDIDRQLMIFFQKEIPLKPRPFEVLGKGMGIHSADVMLRLNRLQEDSQVGRICALFDAEKMGYQSHLAALRVPEECADRASYYILGHPGVTQCVKRKGSFNFWFSITLPAEESLGFHLGSLKEFSKAQQLLIFKTEKIYKPLGKSETIKTQEKQARETSGEISEDVTPLERKLIRAIQEKFPLADDPYGRIAKEIGSTEEFVLKQLQFFQKKGLLKKIALLPAARLKKAAGALLLWNIPEEKIGRAGEAIAAFSEVGFCAKRVSHEALPYNLHVLTDGVEEERDSDLINRIESRIGMWPRLALLNEKEERRGKFKFFSKDIEDWRLQHEGQIVSFFSA